MAAIQKDSSLWSVATLRLNPVTAVVESEEADVLAGEANMVEGVAVEVESAGEAWGVVGVQAVVPGGH
eukprot:4088199-Prymnesium_polylepis.1